MEKTVKQFFLYSGIGVTLSLVILSAKDNDPTEDSVTPIFVKENVEGLSKLPKKKDIKGKGKYHYRITISDSPDSEEIYEVEEFGILGNYKLTKKQSSYDYLNGTYDWYMDTYINNYHDIYQYIKDNYSWLKNYKVTNHALSVPGFSNESSDIDYFQDNYDNYWDDPEDEITYDPLIFEASID